MADIEELIETDAFQNGVDKWMDPCFGAAIKADITERCDRFIEEALEFVQAAGYSAERAHALVDYTFGRPLGDINQEVGGVMVTLAAMCNTLRVDIGAASEAELRRVWTKIDNIRAKQAVKPTGSALPIAANEAATALSAQQREIAELRGNATSLKFRTSCAVFRWRLSISGRDGARITTQARHRSIGSG